MRAGVAFVGTGAVLVGLTMGGCATSDADGAMKRGAYDEAAAGYEAELRANPGDPALERRRDEARQAAFRAKLEKARAVRASGHGDAALSMLDEALRMESRWSLSLGPDLKALRDAEVTGAEETVETAVHAKLSAGAPLAAQERAAAFAPLLGELPLRPIAEKAQAEIAVAGKARCDALARQHAQTPYLARLLVDYCARVGGTFTAPAPAGQSRGLRVSGRLVNATEAQHRILEAWLADVFRGSPWYAADAPNLSRMDLIGRYDARLERRQVTLRAPYRTVTRSVVTEGLLGPTATVETESEHIFEYEAEQYDARYGLDATLTLDLGAGPPLVIDVKQVENKRAFEHGVRFPQANVYPQRANLPDVNTWLTTFLGTKRTPMLRKLRARWVKSYCGGRRFTPEEAARCLQAGQRLPAAEDALATVFGEDTQAVVETVTRPRADERRPEQASGSKTAAPAKPDIEEVPRTGMGESI